MNPIEKTRRCELVITAIISTTLFSYSIGILLMYA